MDEITLIIGIALGMILWNTPRIIAFIVAFGLGSDIMDQVIEYAPPVVFLAEHENDVFYHAMRYVQFSPFLGMSKGKMDEMLESGEIGDE